MPSPRNLSLTLNSAIFARLNPLRLSALGAPPLSLSLPPSSLSQIPKPRQDGFPTLSFGPTTAAAAPGAPVFGVCRISHSKNTRSREEERGGRGRAGRTSAARPPSFVARAMLPLNLLKAAQGHPMVSQEIRFAQGATQPTTLLPPRPALRGRDGEKTKVPERASLLARSHPSPHFVATMRGVRGRRRPRHPPRSHRDGEKGR